jgi:outer membrane receptor for ferrienterochelin and colicins
MIDYRQVASKTNGAQIFSYINVKNAFTQGIEVEANWYPNKNLNITTGYQYLVSGDKDELKDISSKKVFTRNADGTSRVMNVDEYRGLPNRSKHMYNVKIFYQPTDRIFITLRVMYKSNWYVSDRDGNGLINSNDESAQGYFLTNVSAGKRLGKITTMMMGIDNLTNYNDVIYLPNLQGRMIFCSANFKLK